MAATKKLTQKEVENFNKRMAAARARAKKVAYENRHTIVAIGAAGVAGFIEGYGVKLPHLKALGIPATYGLIAVGGSYLATGEMKTYLKHAATGLLSAGVYGFALKTGVKMKEDKKNKVSGDDYPELDEIEEMISGPGELEMLPAPAEVGADYEYNNVTGSAAEILSEVANPFAAMG